MEFNLTEAENLLDLFGGEEGHFTVVKQGDSLIAYSTDYPDDGSLNLSLKY